MITQVRRLLRRKATWLWVIVPRQIFVFITQSAFSTWDIFLNIYKHEIETTNKLQKRVGSFILIGKSRAYRVTHGGITLANGCLSPMRNNAITLQRTLISSYTTNPSAHIFHWIWTELVTSVALTWKQSEAMDVSRSLLCRQNQNVVSTEHLLMTLRLRPTLTRIPSQRSLHPGGWHTFEWQWHSLFL